MANSEDINTNDLETIELDELTHRIMKRILDPDTTKVKVENIDEMSFDNLRPFIKCETNNVQIPESKSL